MNTSLSPRRRKVLWAVGPCAVLLLSLIVANAATAPSVSHATVHRGAAGKLSRLPSVASSASSTAPAHSSAPVALGSVSGAQEIEIALVLRGQHSDQLAATLAAIDNPRSPSYHHYLTPSQYADEFGPSADARAQAEAYLRRAGFANVTSSATSTLVQARGTAAQVAATFGVTLLSYRAPDGSTYIAPQSAPRVPQALVSAISGVLGLDTRHLVHTQLAPTLPRQISGVSGLTPSDLAAAYDLGPLQSAGLTGSGVTVALAEIDQVASADIQAYDQQYNISAPPVERIPVSGGATSYSPEPALDIEVLHAVAPQAHILDYEGQGDFASLAKVFSRIVTDNRAKVLSISLGACEPDLANADGQAFIQSVSSTFQQANAQGMSVLVASGDNGAYGCATNNLAVSVPASDPNVTAVGGTALFINSDGSYNREAGWEGPLEQAGTGGGTSTIYNLPSWQTGLSIGGALATGGRLVPDVSADADPLTGYNIYYSGGKPCPSGGCFQVVGGTSAAAPFWAGLIALADQRMADKKQNSLGFLNPTLYSLASASASAAAFHDVTLGGNLFYQCTPGWDAATGLGTPDAAVLVNDLVGGA